VKVASIAAAYAAERQALATLPPEAREVAGICNAHRKREGMRWTYKLTRPEQAKVEQLICGWTVADRERFEDAFTSGQLYDCKSEWLEDLRAERVAKAAATRGANLAAAREANPPPPPALRPKTDGGTIGFVVSSHACGLRFCLVSDDIGALHTTGVF
jgi:hypothetical protein